MTLFLITFLTVSAGSAQTTVSWGVELGDTAVYWIEDIRSSATGDSNLAILLLDDANRTQYMSITAIDDTSLNYTLGLANASEIIPNQQISIIETDLNGQSVLIPNGSLPLILPLSAGSRSDYLSYLSSQVNFANSFLDSIFQSENISDITEASIEAVYLSTFLNISASARVNNLDSFSTDLLEGINVTDQLSINENQTINDIWVDLLFAFNSTDGTLMEFDFNTALNTTSIIVNENNETSTINNVLTFNATIIRQNFIPFSPEQLASAASAADEASFFIIGLVPAFYLLRRRRV